MVMVKNSKFSLKVKRDGITRFINENLINLELWRLNVNIKETMHICLHISCWQRFS